MDPLPAPKHLRQRMNPRKRRRTDSAPGEREGEGSETVIWHKYIYTYKSKMYTYTQMMVVYSELFVSGEKKDKKEDDVDMSDGKQELFTEKNGRMII